MDGRNTCVSAEGTFVFGVHRPAFYTQNLREDDYIGPIGTLPDGTWVDNSRNFPQTNSDRKTGDTVYEIPNPFPFRGTTYINARWADRNAAEPDQIGLPEREPLSFKKSMQAWLEQKNVSCAFDKSLYASLPRPLLIAVAEASTDPAELIRIAETVCTFTYDRHTGDPTGMVFKADDSGSPVPDIKDQHLFDIVANNPFLPDAYKKAMVLVPGIQGGSEVTAEWKDSFDGGHVFEYLRANSYIPWGHFAANMGHGSVRYRAADLSYADIRGMRHLYYQRTYARLARQLGIPLPASRRTFAGAELETLRLGIQEKLLSGNAGALQFNASLWGWNFGFGYAHSGYRLHASHQQVHQQYAMIPPAVSGGEDGDIPSYHCGDMVDTFTALYRRETGTAFFENYLAAIRSNSRTDGKSTGDASLVVFENDHVLLFVPKAQTSQWELQLMPKTECGNILEASAGMRASLDLGILVAVQVLEALGAEMVTSIEFSKRFDSQNSDQRILYAFLPRIPYSPGAFSEAQLRWIAGHYPEDFATACRLHLPAVNEETE